MLLNTKNLKRVGGTKTQTKISLMENLFLTRNDNVQLHNFTFSFDDFKTYINMYITNPLGRISKKMTIIFINNRLVNCQSLERCMAKCISNVCTMINKVGKNGYLCYMTLCIPNNAVDINIHPTKKTVQFMYEQEISELLQENLEEKLSKLVKIRALNQEINIINQDKFSRKR